MKYSKRFLISFTALCLLAVIIFSFQVRKTNINEQLIVVASTEPTIMGQTNTPDTATKAKITNLYGKLPLTFVENKGQFDSQVRFCARSPQATVYFCQNEVVFHFVEKKNLSSSSLSVSSVAENSPSSSRKELVLRISFPDANPSFTIEGLDELEGKVNVFKGNDSTKWLTDISAYKKIIYHNLWDGIDLVYYGMPEYGMKYDLVVHPGANPSKAQFKYAGHDRLFVNSDDELIIDTAFGEIVEKKPYVYQEIDEKQAEISGNFEVASDVIFWSIGNYDKTHELVIDPGLIYSTFLGGVDRDRTWDIAVDSSGCVYISGTTDSLDFPTTTGAFDKTYSDVGLYDAFVSKLSATGDILIYSTYLGQDVSYTKIGVDSLGCAYIYGSTKSDFPTTLGAYDGTYNSEYTGERDAFLTKLSATGDSLIYSTYLGGTWGDNINYGDLFIDTSGCAYVTGQTLSSDFPTTPGAFDRDLDIMDCGKWFVTKFNSTGTALIYSTFLGGSSGDGWHCDIFVDSSGRAYIAGHTSSPDFPTTPGAFDRSLNNNPEAYTDIFVTKLNATGTGLVYSTFLGGSKEDEWPCIFVDASGCAYVTGQTLSSDFPTTDDAYDKTLNNSRDAFITKLNSTGTALLYSTYLGGSAEDASYGLLVDSLGCVYITGYTDSSDFPTTPNALDTTFNLGHDIFITKFSSTGTALRYSTYFGSSDSDTSCGLFVDSSGYVYIAGTTNSSDFPTTPNAFDTTWNGKYDVLAAKINIPACIFYVDDFLGNDSWDGLTPEWDGAHGPKKTIQAGIEISVSGDSVRVADGIYQKLGNRDIDFGGRAIELASANGAGACIIDSQGSETDPHRGFVFHSGETTESVLDGFTIINGYSSLHGGSIICENGSSPTIKNCIIKANIAEYSGGAIACFNGSIPAFINCLITNNFALGISEGGGAIFLYGSSPVLSNCTIADNIGQYGGGIYCYESSPIFNNSIIWGNSNEQLYVITCSPELNYCDIQGGWLGIGMNNMDANPLFVSGAIHKYYLSQISSYESVDSPCINIGSDTATNLGLNELTTRSDGISDEGVVDLGYHIPYALWIYSITRRGTETTIYWNSLPDTSYIVEWSEDMSSWTQVPVGQVSEWTDTNAGGYSKKFYQVIEE